MQANCAWYTAGHKNAAPMIPCSSLGTRACFVACRDLRVRVHVRGAPAPLLVSAPMLAGGPRPWVCPRPRPRPRPRSACKAVPHTRARRPVHRAGQHECTHACVPAESSKLQEQQEGVLLNAAKTFAQRHHATRGFHAFTSEGPSERTGRSVDACQTMVWDLLGLVRTSANPLSSTGVDDRSDPTEVVFSTYAECQATAAVPANTTLYVPAADRSTESDLTLRSLAAATRV